VEAKAIHQFSLGAALPHTRWRNARASDPLPLALD